MLPSRLALAFALSTTATFAAPPKPSPRLRELDFSPFQNALAAFPEARRAAVSQLILSSSLPELKAALASGSVSSTELTLAFLLRIQQRDEKLRGYTELNPRALDEAAAADRARAAGQTLGPLHGIPLNLKDNIGTVAPMHTTAGAEILLNHSPASNAVVTSNLRAAGAVILGKTSLSELAGTLTTSPLGANAVSGAGLNPYNHSLTPSGSSSGSAITTAAFLTSVSVGTETSGSLLSPGASNGVVAMKPSRGTVSSTGIIPLVRFQDSAGPIARSVTDAAILLDAIDSTTTDYSASLKPDALKDVPVGILRSDLSSPDNKLWLDRIDAGLLKAGALPRDTSLSGKVDLLPVVFIGLWQDSIAYMASTGLPVRSVPNLIAYNKADAPRRIPRGQNLLDAATQIIPAVLKDAATSEADAPALYEKLALEARSTAANALSDAFKSSGASLLVSLANRHSEFYATAGFPAITVPLGLSPDGTPNGITFIARPGEDALLLARAFAFEQATRLRANPPE